MSNITLFQKSKYAYKALLVIALSQYSIINILDIREYEQYCLK